jgi:hypothetical protein
MEELVFIALHVVEIQADPTFNLLIPQFTGNLARNIGLVLDIS